LIPEFENYRWFPGGILTVSLPRLSVLFVVLAAPLILSQCEFVAEEDNLPLETAAQPIIGGQPDSGHPAVGAVQMTQHLCSDTLISPKIVLTAAHCVATDTPVQFGMGPSTSNATAIYNIVKSIPHPQFGQQVIDNAVVQVHDIAVVVLQQAASTPPIKFRTQSIVGMEGSPITFVGYGQSSLTNPYSSGKKMYVASTIGDVNAQGFWNFTTPANPKNTCVGDSGGPALLSTGGVEEVISVVSAGDEGCVQNGWNTRVDIHAAWIQNQIEAYDSGSVNPVCGNGLCESSETEQCCPADCSGGQTGLGDPCNSPSDCNSPLVCVTASDGSYCTQLCPDPNGGGGCPSGWTCAPLQDPPPSGEGVCIKTGGGGNCGNGVCESGESSQSCPSDCGGGGCGSITYQGCCNGETLTWCENEELQEMNCSNNPSCGWNTQAGFYDCGSNGGEDPSGAYPKGCGGGPVDPVCGNNKCEPGESEQTCPADCGGGVGGCGDGVCGKAENYESCAADCTAADCGNTSYEGCCAGEVLTWCENGGLLMINCVTNEKCGWFSDGGYYNCGTAGGSDPSGQNQLSCDGGGPPPVCGNGMCEAGENEQVCAADCGPNQAVCGNGVCETGENILVCAADCGITEPECGDGTCDEEETATSCPADCGSKPVDPCGDGTCAEGETEASCPADCDDTKPDPTKKCGDGTCGSDENCASCAEDCGICIGGGGNSSCNMSPVPASPWPLLLLLALCLFTRRRTNA